MHHPPSRIHVCSTALEAILVAIRPRPEDVIVTLGDYIDWGRTARACWTGSSTCAVAAARLDRKPKDRAKMLVRLLATQRQDGGFVTDYDAQGKPIGQANVETTSLVILALNGQSGA